MMVVCVMDAACNPYMECDGSVLTVQTMTCAVCVIMETNISYGTDFTE